MVVEGTVVVSEDAVRGWRIVNAGVNAGVDTEMDTEELVKEFVDSAKAVLALKLFVAGDMIADQTANWEDTDY
jgi:hypothetical protein